LDYAKKYVNRKIYLVKDKLMVVKAACEYMATELCSHPIVRERLQ